jgi:RHH-type transcriptional regulator, rel operon repressor / antitoxin RelB
MSDSQHPSNATVILSIRVPSKTRKQLEDLAHATGRTKSFLAAEAIEHYLLVQSWQVREIKSSMKKANSKKAKFISHQKVAEWLHSFGTEKEQEPPK